MFNKRSWPVWVLILSGGIFLAFKTFNHGVNPPGKYSKILTTVGEIIEQVHFSPKKIDDNFSKVIFKKYFEKLDPEKDIFLQQDLSALKKFETKIDDEIHGDSIRFFYAINTVFLKRVAEAKDIYTNIIDKPIDFSIDETVNLDPKKTGFPSNENERKDFWRKRIKFMILDRYNDLLEQRESNKGKEGFVEKSDEELQKDATARVKKIMDKYFDRMISKTNDDKRFAELVNTISETMDPHTNYFPPIEKRAFDESMSRKFYGIGALLEESDGNIRIKSLTTGMPAWKSNQISVGDVILKVAQGNEEPVDIVGYETEDAVKIIRGNKGTEVKLTLRKADGSVKVVSLIRDEIKLDEALARSVIINDGKRKLGFISLPDFYADFSDANGAKCSDDVAKEVVKLKSEGVDGIIIDLRNNGGGSLDEVRKMVGLFIEDGPVVQVKDKDGTPTVLKDRDKSVLYDGPLAVMVNEFSASASEIFAAAIQDYNRGVIIGSTSSFGKGTVQRQFGLERDYGYIPNPNSELGSLKVTIQKFYRINGSSTQQKGVVPDVVIPDPYESLKFREKDDEDALPYDEIAKAPYKFWTPGYDVEMVKKNSAARISNNPAFKLIKETTEWQAKQNDKVYPLQLAKYREEQKALRATSKQLEKLVKLEQPLNLSSLSADANKYGDDKDKAERFKAWIKSLSSDIYIGEAVNVMNDMLNQSSMALKEK